MTPSGINWARRLGLIAAAAALCALLALAALRWINPPTTSVIARDNFGGATAQLTWRPLHQISAAMAIAVIAAEDQRFLHHHGLDFVELWKTVRALDSRPRGASTITQQVAKNLLLWKARSYPRKVLEAFLAVFIDFTWGKRRVLEVYLNIAQFGPQIYGVENAAQHFFNKPAAALNQYEAARVAAVLPNPNRRAANKPSAQVLDRQRWILRQMRNLGGIATIKELRR